MTKCGSPGSEADINTWHDTHGAGLPCAQPLHPHVFHTHFPIPPFFLVCSKHRYVRRGFLGKERSVQKEAAACFYLQCKIDCAQGVFLLLPSLPESCVERGAGPQLLGATPWTTGKAALGLLGKVPPGRLAPWKVHAPRELCFLLWLWIIGADTWGAPRKLVHFCI